MLNSVRITTQSGATEWRGDRERPRHVHAKKKTKKFTVPGPDGMTCTQDRTRTRVYVCVFVRVSSACLAHLIRYVCVYVVNEQSYGFFGGRGGSAAFERWRAD